MQRRWGGGARNGTTRLRRALAVVGPSLLVVSLLSLVPQSTSAASPAPLVTVDYSSSATSGAGYRIADRSGHAVESHLLGYQPTAPVLSVAGATFSVTPQVNVTEENLPNGVKETITLSQLSPAEFRFSLAATGLAPREAAGGILLDAPGAVGFFMPHPTAWDAHGGGIPVTAHLDGGQVVVTLDPAVLANATAPITIDPPIIVPACASSGDGPYVCLNSGSGPSAPPNATVGPYRRTLFQTADGRLVFFFRAKDPQGQTDLAYAIYRMRADGSAGWDPTQFVTDQAIGATSDLAVTQRADGNFVAAYAFIGSGGNSIASRVLSLDPSDSGRLVAGSQLIAGKVASNAWPNLSVVDYVADDLPTRPHRTMVGYETAITVATTNTPEYVTAASDNGAPYGSAMVCELNATRGMLATQPVPGQVTSRALCLTDPGASRPFNWRILSGVWGTAASMPFGIPASVDLPATTTTDDGRLHLVASPATNQPQVRYTYLSPGGSSWSTPQSLGAGASPTISTTGTSLHVFASSYLSGSESWIREYVATDGTTWHPGTPLAGRPYAKVYDYNTNWAFTDGGWSGSDVLFSIGDGTNTIGNRIGTAEFPHRLDNSSKRVALSFVADNPAGLDVDELSVYVTWSGSSEPSYRAGLQADDPAHPGQPDGHWLNELVVAGAVVSGAFGTLSRQNWLEEEDSVKIAPVHLNAGQRYHLVVDTPPAVGGGLVASGPDLGHWGAVHGVGVDVGAAGTFSVLDSAGTTWTTAPDQVPWLTLRYQTASVLAQRISAAPSSNLYMTQNQVPGESFTLDTPISPSSLRLDLSAYGSPTTQPVVRVLDAAGTELWSGAIANPARGWVSVAVSGLVLQAGIRYRLVVDDVNAASSNWWSLVTSGSQADSWHGTDASSTTAPDRRGYNDRTAGAGSGIVAFNSGPGDAVYVSDTGRFDHIAVTKSGFDPGQPAPLLSYWNGSAWAMLTTSTNTLLSQYFSIATFIPPADWASTTVNGTSGFWVRMMQAAGTTGTVAIGRITSIHNFTSPTSAPRASGYVPIAWRDLDTSSVAVDGYDAVGPRVATTTPPFGDVASSPSAVAVTWSDAAGITNGSQSIAIDGVGRVANFAGTTATATVGSTLPSGIHALTLGALDGAGNAATQTVPFAVAPPGGSPASGSLDPSSTLDVQVNPSGASPGPSSVTFHSAAIRTQSWQLSFPASAQVGVGDVVRDIDLSQLQVRFSNGASSSAAPTPRSVVQPVAVAMLGTSGGPMITSIDSAVVAIPSFSVAVPAGYSTPTSTATLVLPSPATLGPPRSTTEESEFGGPLGATVPVQVQTTICVTVAAECTANPQTTVARAFVGGQWRQVPMVIRGASESDHAYAGTDPGCYPRSGTCGQHPRSFSYSCQSAGFNEPLRTGCGESNLAPALTQGGASSLSWGAAVGCDVTTSVNLCTGGPGAAVSYFSLVENLFAYSVPGCTQTQDQGTSDPCVGASSNTPDHFVTWQQNHAQMAPATASCPMGGSGTVSSQLDWLAANYTSDTNQGSSYSLSAIGTTERFDSNGAVNGQGTTWGAELGDLTSPGAAQDPQAGDLGYQIAHQIGPAYVPPDGSSFMTAMGQLTTLTGGTTAAPGSATSAWVSATPDLNDLEMFSGADFAASAASSPPIVEASALAQFEISFAACA